MVCSIASFVLAWDYILHSFTRSEFSYILALMYFILFAAIVLLVKPYKKDWAAYNYIDFVLYLWQGLFAVSITLLNFSSYLQRGYMLLGYTSILFASIIISTCSFYSFGFAQVTETCWVRMLHKKRTSKSYFAPSSHCTFSRVQKWSGLISPPHTREYRLKTVVYSSLDIIPTTSSVISNRTL